jgi:integrase
MNGERRCVYSWRLVVTDPHPAKKKKQDSLREMEKNISGLLSAGFDVSGQKMTVNAGFDELIAIKKSTVSWRTCNAYIAVYNKHIRDTFGKKKIADVTYSMVLRFYCDLVDKSGLSTATVDTVNAIFTMIFENAIRNRIINFSPVKGAYKELRKTKKDSEEIHRRKPLKVSEQRVLLEFLEQSEQYRRYYYLVTFLLNTGLRIGECLALQWSDIDRVHKSISITKQIELQQQEDRHYKNEISLPKTASGLRKIPLTDNAAGALTELKRWYLYTGIRCKDSVDGYDDFVFLSWKGTPLSRRNINTNLKKICKACNEWENQRAEAEKRQPVQIPDFTPHVLRHTFASMMIESGMKPKTLQQILGHADISITLNVYTEISQEALDGEMTECVNNWNKKIAN